MKNDDIIVEKFEEDELNKTLESSETILKRNFLEELV